MLQILYSRILIFLYQFRNIFTSIDSNFDEFSRRSIV